MDVFNRVMVCLDLSEIDPIVIKYTSFICDLFPINQVYFFHAARSLELPENLEEEYHELLAPTDEVIRHEMQSEINEYFKSSCPYEIEVKEGKVESSILKWTRIKEVDLIVVGKKVDMKGTGVMPGKIARSVPASMLLVPEFAKTKISKIMIPVDFSKNSTNALAEARVIQSKLPVEIILQNTYTVPSGYHKSGKSYEEFAEVMKSHAQRGLQKYIDEHASDLSNVSTLLSLDDDKEPADKIYEDAIHHDVDFIIMASKGRTGAASFLLGSVADRICQLDSKIPTIITKVKKENLSFFEALLRL